MKTQHFEAVKKWRYLHLMAIAILAASCGGRNGDVAEQPAMKVDFLSMSPVASTLEKKYPGTIEGVVNVNI